MDTIQPIFFYPIGSNLEATELLLDLGRDEYKVTRDIVWGRLYHVSRSDFDIMKAFVDSYRREEGRFQKICIKLSGGATALNRLSRKVWGLAEDSTKSLESQLKNLKRILDSYEVRYPD